MSGKFSIGSQVFVFVTMNLLWTLLPQSCSGEGVFELSLSSFESFDRFRDVTGQCCDGQSCTGSCRTFFRVCLQHYQNSIDPNGDCTFGQVITPVLGNDTIIIFPSSTSQESSSSSSSLSSRHQARKFDNPIKFLFEFQWTGTFSLIIEAWNSKKGDLTTSPESSSNSSLIFRLATPRWLDVGSNWTEESHTTNRTSLKYSYRVLCQANYYGKGCSRLCRPRDDKFGHYTCSPEGETQCIVGWSGEYCTKVICATGCSQQHGTCNKPNECVCRTGWQGRSCDQCIRYPGCQHGTCNQPWQCTCDEGWGGLFCNQDLNYCTNHKPCKNGGTCTNTGQGSYTCACPHGFTGTNCEVRVDGCLSGHAPPCANGGTCLSSGANVSCICPPGYSGILCETKILSSACLSSPCANGGTCVPAPYREGFEETFSCICPDEYEGDACQRQKDICKPSPCMHGGQCIGHSDNTRFVCECPTGFQGNRCQVNVDDCAGQPCYNGGTCVDEVNGFRCHCVPGFTGDSCQQTVDYCLLKPCANGGTCHDLLNDFRCTCQPGFTGKDCSFNIDECRSSPCLHGGTCQDRVNEFVCLCKSGYGGLRCELGPGPLYGWPATNDEVKSVVVLAGNDLGPITSSGGGQPEDRSSTGVVGLSRQIGELNDEGRLSPEQVAMVATFSAAVPLLALIAVTIILIVRHRKRRERERHEAEVTRQNKLNSMNNSKCYDKTRQIVNPLDKAMVAGANGAPRRTVKVTNDHLCQDPAVRKSNSSSMYGGVKQLEGAVPTHGQGPHLTGTLQRTTATLPHKQTNLEAAAEAVNRCPSLASVVLKDDSSADVNATLQRTSNATQQDRKLQVSNAATTTPPPIGEPIYRSDTPREVCPHGIYVIEDHYTSQYGDDVLATEV